MATTERVVRKPKRRELTEMSWDPITRIVGSLGIFTKIDFENRETAAKTRQIDVETDLKLALGAA